MNNKAETDAQFAHECSEAVLAMAVARLGGLVEGHPTTRINFLQRVDDLVETERKLGLAVKHVESLASLCQELVEAITGDGLVCDTFGGQSVQSMERDVERRIKQARLAIDKAEAFAECVSK